MPQMGVKTSLPFVSLTDSYQVIRIAQVELSGDGAVSWR